MRLCGIQGSTKPMHFSTFAVVIWTYFGNSSPYQDKFGEFGSLARHSWGTVIKAQLGHIIENSWAQLGHKVTWGTVEAKPVGAQLRHTWGTVGAQSQERREKSKFGHSWGIVQAHLGHTFISGTVGAQNIFTNCGRNFLILNSLHVTLIKPPYYYPSL